MKNHTRLDGFNDRCPVHGNPARKVYEFGREGDAEVYTFVGCRCAVALKHDPIGQYQPVATYHQQYASAAGVARLHSMQADATYGGPLGKGGAR